jgi:glutathione S-transferase
MVVRLHRCPLMFIRTRGHGCLNVQRALEDASIEHEVVKVPLRRSHRAEVIALTGQQLVPVIQWPDGTAYRAESADMVASIRSGDLG